MCVICLIFRYVLSFTTCTTLDTHTVTAFTYTIIHKFAHDRKLSQNMVKMSITFSQIGSHGNNTYINKIYLFGVKRKVNTDNYCDWLPEEGNLLSKLKIVISE